MPLRKIYWAFFILLIFISSCGSAKKMAARQKRVDTVVGTARSFLGTPYKWGGVNRAGMDCSGLLYNSFSSINVDLPRTADAQQQLGKKVKMKDLEPGDLVFFATGNKKRKVTHVGMVTQRRSKEQIYFIHSSSSRGVIESNIFENYYIKRFRVARRIF